MKWSLKLGSFAGIGVYIHWTFLLLIAFIAFLHVDRTQPLAGQTPRVVGGVLFVLAIFGCVLLHEFGHALTAKRFGVRTRDITLLPIGGVARLERMPTNPWHEFWITVAGPAVNVVIAAALIIVLLVSKTSLQPGSDLLSGDFVMRLMWVNVLLVVFNMLPAFPMDGGRILRSVLAMRLDYALATEIAARVGQAMAILFGLLGLFAGNVFLMLIALFVFLGAEAESQAAKMRSAFRGLNAADAMMSQFVTLRPDDTLERAAEELIAGAQQEFPVVDDAGTVVGMLRRAELLGALRAGGLDSPVRSAMKPDCPVVAPTEALERVYERMQEAGCNALPVVWGGRVVGLVSAENVGELVMIRSALGERASRPPTPAEQRTAAGVRT